MPPEGARRELDLSFRPLLVRAPRDSNLSPDSLLDPLLNPRTVFEHEELRSRSFNLHKARATLDSPSDIELLHWWSGDVLRPRRDMLLLHARPVDLALHPTCTLQLATQEGRRFQPSNPLRGQSSSRTLLRIGPREL